MSHNPARIRGHLEDVSALDSDRPAVGDRWSTWDGSTHGPGPRPAWVITELAAVDEELGVLKTGKEADVHLVRRFVPGVAGRDVTMAAKRYRPSERRMFHRDAAYLEGRRVRRSREMRAMARRTEFGMQVIATQWAAAEFGALGKLWHLGLPVPYPVQLSGTELILELIGTPDAPAPRLSATRPSADQLPALFDQVVDVLTTLAEHGWAHGDLSAYNLLLDVDRIVVIDWPQLVDVVGNPQGFQFLQRDVANICRWFTAKGHTIDDQELFGDLAALAAAGGYG